MSHEACGRILLSRKPTRVGMSRLTSRWQFPSNRLIHPEHNKSFEHGDCERWILTDNGKDIGRIAAFVIRKVLGGGATELSAGIGFFECINDQVAANLLFDTGKKWLEDQGATYMDGPINFGRRDKWWGLLTKGFELEPNYQCNYNFPYYTEFSICCSARVATHASRRCVRARPGLSASACWCWLRCR